jgi:CRP/FNR family transcriptional regulator
MIATNSSCKGQSQRPGQVFDKLPADVANDLLSVAHAVSYPSNVLLFSELEQPQKVFVVLEGEVKLSMNSRDGRRLILHIARKGEIVGLASALSGKPQEMTAETLYPAKLAVLARRDFLAFLLSHPEAYQTLFEELSHQFTQACGQLRNLGLSSTAPEKLARLLLDWSENAQTNESGSRFHFSFTHQEIGEFIGATRETVTRTLSEFKTRHLIAFHGSTLTIPNRIALESYAHC